MKNERGAGRKSKLAEEQFDAVLECISKGESVSKIATELGISRQANYKRIKDRNTNSTISLDYMVDGVCITHIEADVKAETARITNYAAKLSLLSFGVNLSEWDLKLFGRVILWPPVLLVQIIDI